MNCIAGYIVDLQRTRASKKLVIILSWHLVTTPTAYARCGAYCSKQYHTRNTSLFHYLYVNLTIVLYK